MSAEDAGVSKPSGQYALNVVQNPALLEVAYRAIRGGVETESELVDALDIDEETASTISTGLRIFGLAGKSDFEYRLNELAFDAGDFDTRFRLHILNSVARDSSPGEWGVQAGVLLTLEYLLDKAITRFEQTDEALIRQIDEWHVDQGYEPQSQQGRMKLNQSKFSHWTNQASYLRLLHGYEAGRRSAYVVRFDPDLIATTIEIAAERIGQTDGVEFASYLDWMESNCLRIPVTSENDLPTPFARTLYELVDEERLQITKRGDPTSVGLPGIPSHENISTIKNYLLI
jgi:hypothetical protein